MSGERICKSKTKQTVSMLLEKGGVIFEKLSYTQEVFFIHNLLVGVLVYRDCKKLF